MAPLVYSQSALECSRRVDSDLSLISIRAPNGSRAVKAARLLSHGSTIRMMVRGLGKRDSWDMDERDFAELYPRYRAECERGRRAECWLPALCRAADYAEWPLLGVRGTADRVRLGEVDSA